MKRSWSFAEDFGADGIADKEKEDIGNVSNNFDKKLAEDFQLTEQEGGGGVTRGEPLFEFEQSVIGRPQRFRSTLVKQRFRTQKKQLRDARPSDNLGAEITNAVSRVAQNILEETGQRWRNGVQNEDRVLFNFSTPRFNHPLQSAYFRVEEIQQNSDGWEGYLQVTLHSFYIDFT